MPKIRYLKIQFSENLMAYELPYFRAAVIEKTQRQSSLFHNHANDKEVMYRYPLIQYKVSDRKASIVCLEEGSTEIHHLLSVKDMDFRIQDRYVTMDIEDVKMHYHNLQVWDTLFDYHILHWLPLNQRNHIEYAALSEQPHRQLALLEKILRSHMLALASGIDWHVEDTIQVHIQPNALVQTKHIKYKNTDMLAFSLPFSTNVSLPDYIGLGKGTSVGFGVVRGAGKR